MYDLISIGDAVIDTFVPLIDARVNILDNVTHLSLPYGLKVPVGDSTSFVGGNAANNAVGAARLGLKNAIYTNVGRKEDDEADNRIVEKLKKEKVDTRYIIHNSDFPTNHNIILDFKGERTILVHHHGWKYNLPDLDQSKWIYLTSLAPTFIETNLTEQLINYLERTHAKLFYQPGTFQIKMGFKKSARILSLCECLVLNLEEAKMLLGFKVEHKIEIKKLLQGLSDNGVKKTIITDSKNGSYAKEGEHFYKMDIFPAKMIQKTGAGDAFAVGVLASFFYGKDLPEAMRWGSANSASVVESMGPQSGLLTYSKLLDKLKENKTLVAKAI